MNQVFERDNSKSQIVACDDYTATKRKPTNIWTSNQRVLLAYLASHDNTWKDITKLFNSCFQHDMSNQEGLSQGAITSMHYCMELRSDEEAALTSLTTPISSNQPFRFDSLIKVLVDQTAKSLGINLIARTPNSVPRATRLSKQPPQLENPSSNKKDSSKMQTSSKRKLEALLRTPEKKDVQDPTSSYPTPCSPTRPPKRAKFSNLALTEISSQNQSNSINARSLAVLGFRAFSQNCSMGTNGSSGFVAGAFVNATDRIPLSPNPQSSEYLERATLRKSNPALETCSFTNS